jgi:hypothetical protein
VRLRHHHGCPPGSQPSCAGHTRTDAALGTQVGRSCRVPGCGGSCSCECSWSAVGLAGCSRERVEANHTSPTCSRRLSSAGTAARRSLPGSP